MLRLIGGLAGASALIVLGLITAAPAAPPPPAIQPVVEPEPAAAPAVAHPPGTLGSGEGTAPGAADDPNKAPPAAAPGTG